MKPLAPESDQMLHLDALRLIASAGVVLLHFVKFFEGGWWRSVLVATAGDYGRFVDLFFVISGFVIAFLYFETMHSRQDYLAFLKKRGARLLPLHWAILAVFIAVGICAQFAHLQANLHGLFDPTCIVPNFLLLHAAGLCSHVSFNAPSWSISAEAFMYVLTPVYFWGVRRSLLAIAVLTAVIWIALSVFTFKHGLPWYHWAPGGGVVRAVPSFLLGVMLFRVRQHLAGIRYAPALTWIALSGFLIGGLVGLPGLVKVLLLYATAVFAVAADQQPNPSRLVKALAAGGQLTYSSYMIHFLILAAFVNLLATQILHLHGLAMNAVVGASLVLVWPVSYFVLMLYERPMRRAIRGIHWPRKAADAP